MYLQFDVILLNFLASYPHIISQGKVAPGQGEAEKH